MKTTITKLNLEWNLTKWSEEQSLRLSKLETFQPKGYKARGFSMAVNAIRAKLRNAGVTGTWQHTIVFGIVDMARLYAIAAAD